MDQARTYCSESSSKAMSLASLPSKPPVTCRAHKARKRLPTVFAFFNMLSKFPCTLTAFNFPEAYRC